MSYRQNTDFYNQQGHSGRGGSRPPQNFRNDDYGDNSSNLNNYHGQNNSRGNRGGNKSSKSRGSSSHKAYTQKRGEARRENLSSTFQADRDSKIKEILFQGLSESELTKRMGENTISKSLPLTVSTRGIGFGTQLLCYVTSKYKSTVNIPDINGMYRAFLGILEAKISGTNFGDTVEHIQATRPNVLDQSFIFQARTVVKLPEPISRIISVVGTLKTNEEQFLPVIPADLKDMNKLSSIWTEVEDTQSNIELHTDSLENELEVRWRLEGIYEHIRIFLESERKKFSTVIDVSPISQNVPNISFQPYTEEESFQNFTRRFDNYTKLRGNIDPKMKVKLFLQAITPQMHEQLYDICIPDDPYNKTYEELIQLLMAQIEPKPSIWARQHNFMTRTQLSNESIQDYANVLRNLS